VRQGGSAVLSPGQGAPESTPWRRFRSADPHKVPIDPNGNLASKTEGSDNWGYEWNALNELTRVLKNGIEQARFAYDPNGRRIEKVAGGVTTSYTYDGFNILRETRGGTALRYVYGPDVDEPLAVDNGTELSFLHEDALGSITKVTSATGAVTLTRQYDAWGALQVGVGEPGFAFTGREWDPETGLYFYRSRYYDSKLGRFISEDLIRFDGGENFYAYVTDSPTNSVDPFGFCGLGGCNSKMSPTPREPAPPSCIAPVDYPCDCPLVETYDEELYKACLCSGGAAGGRNPSGGHGTAYYSKKCPINRTRMRSKADIIRPQGARACAVGGLAMVASLREICRAAALRCVPMGSAK
jgi:RHS repeat-associated protein